MGVLAAKSRKVELLTGTLMGGYADDLFHLLWRIMPEWMIEDGFRYTRGSIGAAAMGFMRKHGVLKDIYKQSEGKAHRTARGKHNDRAHRQSTGLRPERHRTLCVAVHRLPQSARHRGRRVACVYHLHGHTRYDGAAKGDP